MSTVLLAATPGNGMGMTMLPVIEAFIERGHTVLFLGEDECRRHIEARGARFFSMVSAPTTSGTGARDARRAGKRGLRQFGAVLRKRFLERFDEQWTLVQELLDAHSVDAIVTDPTLLAVSAVAGLPSSERPAVIAIGGFPLPLADPAIAPYGLGLPPGDTVPERVKNAALSIALHRFVLRSLSRDVRRAIREKTGLNPRGSLFDLPLAVDVWAQLTVPSFEYPRARHFPNVEFIGPLAPVDLGGLPSWWDPADDHPVVHLRYEPGTSPDHLLLPTLRGLAEEDVLVVVTGASAPAVGKFLGGPLPTNVRVATSVPYSLLLAHAGAAVKSGDYVRTQYALRWGVPVIGAGITEEHVETNARIRWAGVGVDLRTSRPTAEAIRSAVLHVLGDRAMHRAAARVAAEIAKYEAETRICEIAEELVAASRFRPGAKTGH